ncbi:integrase core domain-containing protein [Sabulicella glaciei]|uniref:Transposase n=1 Tax=Sabulicella glaciei TaxID=2984948 RepID=A0ABT3NWL9_9PROT|nr:transposase [Roseococcus sp. MDT2-1-1]
MHEAKGAGDSIQAAIGYGVSIDFSGLGKPRKKAIIEALNVRLSAESLDALWFSWFADTQQRIAEWRRHQNEEQPQSV